MNYVFNPPKTREAPGLAPNDATMMFPLLGCFLTLGYFMNQQERLLGGYLVNSSEQLPPKLVANLPLRSDDPDEGFVNFRECSIADDEKREQSIMDLFRLLHRGRDSLPMNFTASTQEASKAELAFKFVAENLFKDEAPETRYLPMSFLLEDDEGGVFHGGVERLTLEIDADITKESDVTAPTLRLYATLVDTNWMNLSKGTPRRKHVMFTQLSTGSGGSVARRVDACILDKAKENGGRRCSSLRTLAMDLRPEAVGISTEVFNSTRKHSLRVQASSSTRLRLVYDEGADLFYAARAASMCFMNQIRYSRGTAGTKFTAVFEGGGTMGMHIDGKVLEAKSLTLTSRRAFPEEGLVMQHRVEGVLIETNKGTYYQNSGPVSFDTATGSYFYDAAKTRWFSKGEGALEIRETSRLDLFFKRGDAKETRFNERFFPDFESKRFKDRATLDYHRYNEAHAAIPTMSVQTPEISQTTPTIQIKLATPLLLIGFLVCFLFFWFFPSGEVAFRLGQITLVVSLLFSIFVIISFFSVRFDKLVEVQKVHDDVVFYTSLAILVLGNLSVSASLRFNERVPAGLYAMALIMILNLFLLRATDIQNEAQLTEDMKSWRAAVLAVTFKSTTLFAYECFKLSVKSRNTHSMLRPKLGLEGSPSISLMLVLGIAILPIYRMLQSADSESCEAIALKNKWISQQPAITPRISAVYESERQSEDQCTSSMSQFKDASGKIVAGAIVLAVFAAYISMPLFSYIKRRLLPQKPMQYKPSILNDSRVVFWYAMAKLAVSFFLIGTSIQFLVPRMNFFESEVCQASKASLREFDRSFAGDLLRTIANTASKREQIGEQMQSLDCRTDQLTATATTLLLLLLVWSGSVTTPPRFNYTDPTPSLVEALSYGAFTFAGVAVIEWLFNKENTKAAIELDANSVFDSMLKYFVV